MILQKALIRTFTLFVATTLALVLFLVTNTFAGSNATLVTCDKNGNTGSTSIPFTQADIVISGIDTSGNYNYYGVDIGTFEAPVGNIANPVDTQRVATSSLNLEVTTFGDISKYQSGKTYVLGYRVLYQPIGDNGLNIIESNWKMAPNSYFIMSNSDISLTTCDQDGNIRPIDTLFTQAGIAISDLDVSGNYTYYGADVGVFEAPVSNIANPVYTQRIATNSLNFQVTNFGDLSQYQIGKVYVLGYRVLYQTVGDNGLNVVESNWRMVPNSYFTVAPQQSLFTTCDSAGNIRLSDKIFSIANIATGNLDSSGNYTYYGADVGVFQKPSTLNVSNPVYTERLTTNSLNLEITDFGNISKYQSDQVYVLGYRMLYQTVGDNGLNVVESNWRMVPDSYFRLMPKGLQHLQTIRYMYNYQFKSVDVTGPDESGLQGDELNSYNSSNFATEGDFLTYKVNFDLSDLSKLNNPNVNLLFNTSNDPDIELVLLSAQINGKDIDLTNSRQAKNNYVLIIPTSSLVIGENCLIYNVRVKVYHYTRIFVNITNNATISGTNSDGSTLQIGTPDTPSCNVDTRVFKGEVRYH